MKAKELMAMNGIDLENKIIELKKELMKVNSQIAIGTLPKSPGKVKEMKKTIAKILTIKNNKQSTKQNLTEKQKGGNKKE